MKPKARFITSVVAAAKSSDTELPWVRGARRAAFIARRANQAKIRKSA